MFGPPRKQRVRRSNGRFILRRISVPSGGPGGGRRPPGRRVAPSGNPLGIPAAVLLGLLLAGCLPAGRSRGPVAVPAPLPSALERYKAEFDRAVGDSIEGQVPLRELLAAAARARVLLLGDFHTDRAYHRRALALLDRLADRVGPLLLIVEFLRWEDREDLERYLAARLTLEQLARRTRARNPRSWLGPSGLDREGFLAFLARARARSWLVCPVENIRQPPLELRDRIIARRARAAIEAHRGHYPVVFYGEAHLLGRHRLRPLLGLEAVTVLPRPPRSLRDNAAIGHGGLQRIRPSIYFLGPERERERGASDGPRSGRASSRISGRREPRRRPGGAVTLQPRRRLDGTAVTP